MKKFVFGLAALPLLAGTTLAAEPLNDAQMDRVTGGDTVCSSSTTSSTCVMGTLTSTCQGCTSGQVFVPTSPQTFFGDLNKFLNAVGFKSSCSTSVC